MGQFNLLMSLEQEEEEEEVEVQQEQERETKPTRNMNTKKLTTRNMNK